MWWLCFRGRCTDSPQCLLGESVMRRLVISDGKAEIYNIWSFLTHGIHMKWLPVCCCCNTVKQCEILIHKPARDNKMQDCVYLLCCLECGFVYFPWWQHPCELYCTFFNLQCVSGVNRFTSFLRSEPNKAILIVLLRPDLISLMREKNKYLTIWSL